MRDRGLVRIIYILIAGVLLFLLGRDLFPRLAGGTNETSAMQMRGVNTREPALCQAALAGDVGLVKELIRTGANIDGAGQRHGTPLELAMVSVPNGGNYARVARVLLDHGADPNAFRHSCILNSAIRYLPGIVPHLLDRGADVNDDRMVAWGQHPLSLAIRLRNGPVVHLLLQHGANVNPNFESAALGGDLNNKQAPSVYSPLAMAVCYAPEFEQTLVKLGADLGVDRNSVLVAAARAGRTDLMPRLLKLGADPNGAVKDETPLSVAVTYAPKGVVCLLENGAKPDVLAFAGRSALVQASIEGKTDCVRALLAHGAGVNVRAKTGSTPLTYARLRGHAEVASLLQEAGGTE